MFQFIKVMILQHMKHWLARQAAMAIATEAIRAFPSADLSKRKIWSIFKSYFKELDHNILVSRAGYTSF